MTSLKLPFIQRFVDRHGRVRHYFRRPGHDRVSLPGAPGSAEFMAAYHACLEGSRPPIGAARTTPGTMTALAVSWYGSSEFSGLAPSSQATYRRIVEAFLAAHGDRLVADLQGRHVRALLDSKASTPAAANRLRSILQLLMRHAVERGWRDDDPTLHVRKLRYEKKPFPAWTEDDIAKFEAHFPLGTRARLALALLLYTGQRRSDVIRMGRQHIRAGMIDVKQEKTKTRLAIPMHRELVAALDACPADNMTFLITEQGRPFASGNAFYNWFVECTRAAGIEGLSPHGLRKSIGRRLAEAGCTPHQIAAITGHQTMSEVERYTKSASQETMARTAMGLIGPEPNGN